MTSRVSLISNLQNFKIIYMIENNKLCYQVDGAVHGILLFEPTNYWQSWTNIRQNLNFWGIPLCKESIEGILFFLGVGEAIRLTTDLNCHTVHFSHGHITFLVSLLCAVAQINKTNLGFYRIQYHTYVFWMSPSLLGEPH